MDMVEHNEICKTTKIKQGVGYLGPRERILEAVDQKHMLFREGGDLPFCMTPQESSDTNISQYDEPQLKDKTKAE